MARDLNKSADELAKRTARMQHQVVDDWRNFASLEHTKQNILLTRRSCEEQHALQQKVHSSLNFEAESSTNAAQNNCSTNKQQLEREQAPLKKKIDTLEPGHALFQQLGVLPLTTLQTEILRKKGCTILIGSLGHVNGIFRFKYSVFTSGNEGPKQFVKDSEIFPVSTVQNDPNYVGAETQTMETSEVCAFIFACTWLLKFLNDNAIKTGTVLIECKTRSIVEIINNITQPLCLFVASNQGLVLRAHSLLLDLNQTLTRKVIFKLQDQALAMPFIL